MQSLKLRPIRTMILGVAAILAAGAVHAQDYPNKTVRIVVPFASGGGTDTMARVVANALQKSLGQTFIVENKPGASGNIGLEQVARSPADGYTLVMITNNLAINPSLFQKVGYDPIKDFAPVALVGSSPVAISVSSGSEFKSLADIIRYARENPDKLAYSSCGNGTPQHLAGELLLQMTQAKMAHVSYKGCAPAIPDHISGTVPIAFSTIANLSPHIKAGKARGIAVTGSNRSSYWQDVPTVSEAAKLQGYNIDVWFGLFAPAGTPKEVVAKLNEAVNAAISSADAKQRMSDQNYEAHGGSSAALGELVKRDVARYQKIIKDANIKAD